MEIWKMMIFLRLELVLELSLNLIQKRLLQTFKALAFV